MILIQEAPRFGRRQFLQLVGVAGVAAVSTVLGYWVGSYDERAKLFPKGELSPDLEARLKKDGYFIYRPNGETVESLRKGGMDISLSPWEEYAPFEKNTSRFSWMAVHPEHFYLPTEPDYFLMQIRRSIRQESRKVQQLLERSDVHLVAGEVIDYLGLEQAYRNATGEQLIAPGFILTRTRVEGMRVGIGKHAPGDRFDYGFVWPDRNSTLEPPSGFLPAGILVPWLPDAPKPTLTPSPRSI